MDVNKCIFSGRLCEDPEVKIVGMNEKKIARFRLAVSRYSKKIDDKADYLKFVTWNCANFAEKHLKKGMKVLVEASCNSGTFTNQAGIKVYTTEFNASLITVLDWKTKDTTEEKENSFSPVPLEQREDFSATKDYYNNYDFQPNTFPPHDIDEMLPWES